MKRTILIAFSAIVAVLLLVSVVFLRTPSKTSGTDGQEAYLLSVQEAFTELSLPSATNYSTSAVNTGADSLATFMQYRSGVVLTSTNKAALADLEQKSWTQTKSVTTSQLKQVLTDVALEKYNVATQSEINSATDSLRGFTAPGMPADFETWRTNYIQLRPNGAGTMTPAQFQSYFTPRGTSAPLVFNTMVQNAAESEVDRILNVLKDADVVKARNGKLSPMEAMLVTYSVASGDPLTNNQSSLNQKMQNFPAYVLSTTGESYPSPTGYKAYGVNGYLYSSPTDILLSDAMQNRVIALMKERSGIQ